MKGVAIGLLVLLAASAAKAAPPAAAPVDSNWPCQQIKIEHLSLATLWDGPPLEKYLTDWQNYPKAAVLAHKLAERRVPVDQAKADIAAFAKAAGPDSQTQLLAFFAGLFSLLDQERFDVVQGLDRFGARQKSYAAQIRGEINALHEAQDASQPNQQNIQTLGDKVYWDTRVFKSRDSMMSYACFVPDQIEQRLFALAQATANLLP